MFYKMCLSILHEKVPAPTKITDSKFDDTFEKRFNPFLAVYIWFVSLKIFCTLALLSSAQKV